MIDEDQVRDSDLAEVHAERIHPEVIGEFRITRRYVPGDPLIKTEAREEAKGGGQTLFAMAPFFCGRGEHGRRGYIQGFLG